MNKRVEGPCSTKFEQDAALGLSYFELVWLGGLSFPSLKVVFDTGSGLSELVEQFAGCLN